MKWICRELPNDRLNDDACLKENQGVERAQLSQACLLRQNGFFCCADSLPGILKARFVVVHGTMKFRAFQAHAESDIGLGD